MTQQSFAARAHSFASEEVLPQEQYPASATFNQRPQVERKTAPPPITDEAEVYEVDPLADPRWKAFSDFHPDATVFHRVNWLRALRDCYGYEPRVWSLSPPGSPLQSGIVFCQIRSRLTGARLVSVPFSDHCEPLVTSPLEFARLLRAARQTVARDQYKYIEVRPVFHSPGPGSEFSKCAGYYLHRLDLRPSEEMLLKSFHRDSVRRKIRRAEREKLRSEVGNSEALLDHFYSLLIMTRRRQGLPPQPRKWFQSLIHHLGANLKIRVAFQGDRPVASILTISDKKTVIYKYGCSDARFNKLGGMALLFWSTIQEAKANGCVELDMGRSDCNNAGLIQFKDRWGAKRTIVNYWRYPGSERTLLPPGDMRQVKKLVSFAPDKFLVLLGRLLYRHIG